MSKYKITDLPQRLKISRNHAVLGNYSEALTHYSTAITLIEDRIREISDSFLKEKWKVVAAEVKSEISHCGALLNLCKSFKTAPFDSTKKQEDKNILKSEINTQLNEVKKEFRQEANPFAENLLQDKKHFNNIPINNNAQPPKKEFKPDRFGGKAPFSQFEDNQKERDKGKNEYGNYMNNEGMGNIVYPPNNNPNILDKKDGLNQRKEKERENVNKKNINVVKDESEACNPLELTNIMNDFYQKKDNKQQRDEFNINPYNNNYNKKEDDIFGLNNLDNNKRQDKAIQNDYENFVVYNKNKVNYFDNNNNNNNEYKDPMVWERPPPLEDRRIVKKEVAKSVKRPTNKE